MSEEWCGFLVPVRRVCVCMPVSVLPTDFDILFPWAQDSLPLPLNLLANCYRNPTRGLGKSMSLDIRIAHILRILTYKKCWLLRFWDVVRFFVVCLSFVSLFPVSLLLSLCSGCRHSARGPNVAGTFHTVIHAKSQKPSQPTSKTQDRKDPKRHQHDDTPQSSQVHQLTWNIVNRPKYYRRIHW